jgi:hypothetical protein
VNPRHFARLKELLDTSGGTVVAGGVFDEATKYIAPTILVNPRLDSRIMQVCCQPIK